MKWKLILEGNTSAGSLARELEGLVQESGAGHCRECHECSPNPHHIQGGSNMTGTNCDLFTLK